MASDDSRLLAHALQADATLRLTLGLGNQRHVRDPHLFVHRFAHVVNGQRGDAGGGERLHFDAGLRRDFGRCLDDDAIPAFGDFKGHFAMRDGKRMTERNQLATLLGRLNSRHARCGEHVAFGDGLRFDELERSLLQADFPARDRLPQLNRLPRNVHHPGFPAGVDVGQSFHIPP